MAFVLTIRERGDSWAGRSPATSIHSTEQEAKAELLSYVKANWQSEMDGNPPDDDDEMVRRYFEEVMEAYEISETAA